MVVRTKFYCYKQPKGSILCSYYYCEFLWCTNHYVSNPEDYNPSDLLGDSHARLSHRRDEGHVSIHPSGYLP
ncbi:hypothetical protein ACP70R_048481 [Stipagrostis hirtigluma subsp. patula]